MRHGVGVQDYADGRQYYGEFRNDYISGEGVQIIPNVERYEGIL